MASTIFAPDVRTTLKSRVESLRPDSHRQWGKLTCGQMLAHTGDQVRMALGEIECPRGRGPMAHFPMKHLVLYVLPWPTGKAEAPPQAFTTDPGEFEEDRKTLLSLIDRAAERDGQAEWPDNPIFGRMSQHHWGALTAKHLDHHLRQFGG